MNRVRSKVITSENYLFYMSLIVAAYILMLAIANYYKYNFGDLRILLEIITIPILLLQIPVFILSLRKLIQKNYTPYNLIAFILMLLTISFTVISFI